MINFRSIYKSIGYAFAGLAYVIRTQNNAKFHLLATGIVIGFGIWLQLNLIEWCLIITAIGIVWIAECFNTSLEELFDLVNPDPHPLVKNGKDSGAAAVLIAAFLSIAIGLLVFVPLLIQKFQTLLE